MQMLHYLQKLMTIIPVFDGKRSHEALISTIHHATEGLLSDTSWRAGEKNIQTHMLVLQINSAAKWK